MQYSEKFMQQAIELADKSINLKGGPFGALIVENNIIVGIGTNCVTIHNDPTAHAEINAIRDACKNLKRFSLQNCAIYTSCEPCPMCLAAIYWARIEHIYYGADCSDAARAGFDDAFFYDEIKLDKSQRKIKTTQISNRQANAVFDKWIALEDKQDY